MNRRLTGGDDRGIVMLFMSAALIALIWVKATLDRHPDLANKSIFTGKTIDTPGIFAKT